MTTVTGDKIRLQIKSRRIRDGGGKSKFFLQHCKIGVVLVGIENNYTPEQIRRATIRAIMLYRKYERETE